MDSPIIEKNMKNWKKLKTVDRVHLKFSVCLPKIIIETMVSKAS